MRNEIIDQYILDKIEIIRLKGGNVTKQEIIKLEDRFWNKNPDFNISITNYIANRMI